MNRLAIFVLALVAISCGGHRTSDLREASVAELPHDADSGSSADVIEAGSAAFDVADVADVAELADVSLRGDGGSPDAMLADASEERRSTQPTALTVTPPSSELEVGGSVTLTAMAAYADGSERDVTAMTTFTTTNSAVTVRGRDVVGVNPGTALVTASAFGLAAQATIEVRSIWPLLVTTSGLGCDEHHSLQFRAREPGDAARPRDVTTDAIWTSQNPDVLLFPGSSRNSNAQCMGPGTVTVTADIGALHGEVTLTLTGPSISDYALAGPGVLRVGTTASLVAILQYSNGTSGQAAPQYAADGFTYRSSDVGVVRLLEDHSAFGVAPGTAVVSMMKGATVVASTTVVVSNVPVQSLVITPASVSADYPAIPDLRATATFTDGTQADLSNAVEWLVDRMVTVDGTIVFEPAQGIDMGHFQAFRPGSYRVQAVFDGTTASSTVTLGVGLPNGISAMLNAVGTPLPLGAEVSLEASAYYAGADSLFDVKDVVAWRVGDPSVAVVTAAPPYVQGLKVGTTTLTASLGNVTAEPVSVTFINSAPRSLQFSYPVSSMLVGNQQLIAAEVTYANGSSYAVGKKGMWTAGDTTIATFAMSSTPGMITALRPGTTSVTVQYLGFVARTTLTVTP
jgi:membrane-bound inhibitor of C-type lysozyme